MATSRKTLEEVNQEKIDQGLCMISGCTELHTVRGMFRNNEYATITFYCDRHAIMFIESGLFKPEELL